MFNHADLQVYIDRALATRSLDLSGGQLQSTDDAAFIAEYILSQRLFDFQTFNFSYCNLTPEGLDSLLRASIEQTSLEVFTVCDNRLPKSAGHALSKLLGARGTLRVLEVQNNGMGDVGLASIAGAFSSDLTSLQMNANGSVAAPPLLMLSRLTLCTLDLSGNGIGDLGVETLCRGLQVCSKNVRALRGTMALRTLRLNRNKIGDAGAVALSFLVRQGGPPPAAATDSQQVR